MKSKIELNSLALKTRRLFGEDAYSPIDIFALIDLFGQMPITLVKFPFPSNISGMCVRENEDIIICINSTMSNGRQRFTLAHELYHVLYEDRKERIVCGMNIDKENIDSEKEADQFASYLLMPYDALSQYEIAPDQWTLDKIIEIEQFYKMSHQALLFRLQMDERIDSRLAEKFSHIKITTEALKRGYSADLYKKTEERQQYFTTGEYIRKVQYLEDQQLISQGKAEELLLNGYRSDIVFGIEEGVVEND